MEELLEQKAAGLSRTSLSLPSDWINGEDGLVYAAHDAGPCDTSLGGAEAAIPPGPVKPAKR